MKNGTFEVAVVERTCDKHKLGTDHYLCINSGVSSQVASTEPDKAALLVSRW
jgi:hypothetical protein